MTLNEEARNLRWGPAINEPDSVEDAIRYALNTIGQHSRPASLGEVYAIKSLQWALERLVEHGKISEARDLMDWAENQV